MIENKLFFRIFVIIILFLIMINFPFPHAYPFGETILTTFQIPIRIGNGFHVIGLFSLVLFGIGLFLLIKSLRKWKIRSVIITIIIIALLPPILINFYQNTIATGIYGVSYENDEGQCDFDMINEETIQGRCELSFTNHTSKVVTFDVEFYEEIAYEDDVAMLSLMNQNGLHEVSLNGKERRRVVFEKNIDVSKMEDHMESGSASLFNIIIIANGKSRQL